MNLVFEEIVVQHGDAAFWEMYCLRVLISTNMEQPLGPKEIKGLSSSESLSVGHNSQILLKIRGFIELHCGA